MRCYEPPPYVEPLVGRLAKWAAISFACFLSLATVIFALWVMEAVKQEGGFETVMWGTQDGNSVR